jgi:hypothetical protein
MDEQEPQDDTGTEPVRTPDYDDDEELSMSDIYRSGPHGRGAEGTAYASGKSYPSPARRTASGVFRAADHVQAAQHLLAHNYGIAPDNLHPLAEAEIQSGPRYTLADAAESCLEMNGHQLLAGADPYRQILAAMSTSDFPTVVRETWKGIAESRRNPQLEKIIALTHQLEVEDYKQQSFSMVDLGGMEAPGFRTMHEYTEVHPIPTGEAIQVWSLFARIGISRQALANDDRGMFRAAISAFLRGAHSNEMQKLCALIEAAGNLGDGQPLFHADFGNAHATPGAPSETTLATAMSLLRNQRTEANDKADADPAVILVPTSHEVAALKTVKELPIDARPRVIATAHLTTGATAPWFVLADPEVYPVLGRVRMENAPLSAVTFGDFEVAEEFPGVFLPATHSVGYNILSRIGIVRIGDPE